MIVFERISREFGVNVRAGKPATAAETISGPGRADMLLDRTIRISADDTAQPGPRGRDL